MRTHLNHLPAKGSALPLADDRADELLHVEVGLIELCGINITIAKCR